MLLCYVIVNIMIMLQACQLDSMMKIHADLHVGQFASVHAVLFLSEGLHKENIAYHICI